MRILYAFTALGLLGLGPLWAQAAGNQADIDAVNHWIDRYGAYQEQQDAAGMSVLMADDRICVSHHFGGRRTDNVLNMKIQQAQLDVMKQELPGIRDYVEDRERLITILADGRNSQHVPFCHARVPNGHFRRAQEKISRR